MLPLHCDIQTFIEYAVAPYVGAWIETFKVLYRTNEVKVAPYVGAWIETLLAGTASCSEKSHPTWVRGLKQKDGLILWEGESRTLRGCVD